MTYAQRWPQVQACSLSVNLFSRVDVAILESSLRQPVPSSYRQMGVSRLTEQRVCTYLWSPWRPRDDRSRLGEATSVASVNSVIYSTGDPPTENGRTACFCLSLCSVNLVAYHIKVILQTSTFITFFAVCIHTFCNLIGVRKFLNGDVPRFPRPSLSEFLSRRGWRARLSDGPNPFIW